MSAIAKQYGFADFILSSQVRWIGGALALEGNPTGCVYF